MPSAINHQQLCEMRDTGRWKGRTGSDLSFHRPALTPIYAGIYNADESITVSQCRCRQNLSYAEWDTAIFIGVIIIATDRLLVLRFMLGNFRKSFLRTGEGHNYYFSKAAHANRHYLHTLHKTDTVDD